MKLVSVIMSTYKEPTCYLKQAVESILNQTYKNFEYIIIIDDPDNETLIKQLEAYAHRDQRIKLIRNTKNIGLTASLNKGLKCCKGDYIARMDADDISDLNRLEKEVFFLETKGYDLISCNYILFFDNNEKQKEIRFQENNIECVIALKNGNCLPHPAWLGKKDVFEKLNGYRNIPTCEDYDLVLRAVINGYKIGNVQENLLRYRFNPASISRSSVAIQNVIADYLAFKYRKSIILTIDDYKMYISSDKYINRIKKENTLNQKKINFKSSTSLVFKIFWGIRISVDELFWKKKIKDLKRKFKIS